MPIFGVRPEVEAAVIRPSAYALVHDSHGRLAVVRTPQGTSLPGGGIEAGETPEEAIKREALEECGLAVRPGGWTVRAVQFVYSESETTHFEKRSTFIESACDGIDSSLVAEIEHELLWVGCNAAIQTLTPESHRWAVAEWSRRNEARP